ncbi:uncharacterized protein LOC8259334 isoform X1 [Ricinus communis]|uniref:uncharacterized protein LOC8259334 isoform X1 n=1 Tax=Ricinus communis TaxID=3988 RepID=UPI0007729FAC|nr:uncharacterized protein LOC8259334 isoform X1 [Ricinus communis]|eukprot:XP_015583981.1 uncharacterized protein LOC8259334 isoform X1 [Ricinus communis]
MDRNQPVLVPEWLKSAGSVPTGGNANHQSTSALLHSDDHPGSKHEQNKLAQSGSDRDARPLSVLERTTSAYFRRSSSNNSSAHLRTNCSFGRTQRDRDRDNSSDYNDHEKLVLGDHRRQELSGPLGNFLPSKFDKEKLRRSLSMVTGKQDEAWSKKLAGDLTNTNKSQYSNSNGNDLFARVSVGRTHDTSFEQDFPSLGAEERQGTISRVSSPGLSSSIQTSNDSWKSALAEVPVVMGSSSIGVTSAPQAVPAISASMVPSITTGLNMAESLAQVPSRARTPPQATAGAQRLEELAVRQSKLIPMTPSTPKTLVVSPLEKSKPKIVQQQSSAHFAVNHTRGPGRSDNSKISNEGRLQVLKPSRELNSISSAVKDSSSPTNGSTLLVSPLGTTPLAASSGPLKSSGHSPNHARYSSVLLPTMEKRSMSQVQSRNDFFNHLKKKSSMNSTSAVSDSSPTPLSSSSEKSGESVSEAAAASGTGHGGDSSLPEISITGLSSDNGDAHNRHREFGKIEKDPKCDATPNPDEEEAAFLRSLGWDENAGEDEGLTEEEIRAFYEEYKKKRPSKLLHNGT